MNYHAAHDGAGRRIICFIAFLKDESGSNAIEYGLMMAVLAIIIFTGMSAVSTKVIALFQTISNGF